MDAPFKWVIAFLLIGGVAYGAVTNPEVVYETYQTYFGKEEAPKPPPDMSDYIELKPIEADETDAGGAFAKGKTVYMAGATDLLGWGESEIAMYFTYDGSELDDKQVETHYVDHGTPVKILDWANGRGGRWYRIETVENFGKRGWVPRNFLTSVKPREVESGKDWGTAKEKAEEGTKARQERLKEQQRLLDEAKKRGKEVNGG